MGDRESLHDEIETLTKQSSMDYWWPKLSQVDIPTPVTERLAIAENRENEEGLRLPVPDENDLVEAIQTVDGPPAFLRTDVTSRKHEMKGSSLIASIENPIANVAGVVDQHHLSMGMPMPNSFYVREWLDLYHEYKSFAQGATPIAAEVRVFLHEGEVHDYGFYWPEESIWEHSVTEDNWRELHTQVRNRALRGVEDGPVGDYAARVGERFPTDYWSVDFALTDSDEWYAIDMARGELSWHPDSVKRAVEDPRSR